MTEYQDPVVLEDGEVRVPVPPRTRPFEHITFKSGTYVITAGKFKTIEHFNRLTREGKNDYKTPDEDHVDVCTEWLRQNVESSKHRYELESYALKHVVEGHFYVTEGSLILAAHRLGYRIEIADSGGASFFFKLKKQPKVETEGDRAEKQIRAILQRAREERAVEKRKKATKRARKIARRLNRIHDCPSTRQPITPTVRFLVFKNCNYKCQICGRNTKDHGVVLELDHIVPVARGGTDDITNLHILCFECNRGKGVRYL